MIVCDTGPLVALSNERDERYFAANEMFRDLHMAGETVLVPSTVLAETCYWIDKSGGPEVEATFLDAVVEGTFTLVDRSSSLLGHHAEDRWLLHLAPGDTLLMSDGASQQVTAVVQWEVEDPSAWLVQVADTPGAVSFGRSLAEASLAGRNRSPCSPRRLGTSS